MDPSTSFYLPKLIPALFRLSGAPVFVSSGSASVMSACTCSGSVFIYLTHSSVSISCLWKSCHGFTQYRPILTECRPQSIVPKVDTTTYFLHYLGNAKKQFKCFTFRPTSNEISTLGKTPTVYLMSS